MIVAMKKNCGEREIANVLARISDAGLKGHLSRGIERIIIGVVGIDLVFPDLKETLELMPGVEEVIPITRPYKLCSREFQPENTIIKVGKVSIGGDELVVMAVEHALLAPKVIAICVVLLVVILPSPAFVLVARI